MSRIVPVSGLQTPIVEPKTGAPTALWLKWFSNVQQALQTLTFADVGGTLAAAQLPPNVAVTSFGAGAPAGTAPEGYIYFDTTASPYFQGYVYHAGAWNKMN